MTRPVGAELFQAGGRTNRQTGMTHLIAAFAIMRIIIKSNTTVTSARVSSRYGPEDPASGSGASKPERRHLEKQPAPVLGTCYIVRRLFGLEENLLTTVLLSLVKPAIIS